MTHANTIEDETDSRDCNLDCGSFAGTCSTAESFTPAIHKQNAARSQHFERMRTTDWYRIDLCYQYRSGAQGSHLGSGDAQV